MQAIDPGYKSGQKANCVSGSNSVMDSLGLGGRCVHKIQSALHK